MCLLVSSPTHLSINIDTVDENQLPNERNYAHMWQRLFTVSLPFTGPMLPPCYNGKCGSDQAVTSEEYGSPVSDRHQVLPVANPCMSFKQPKVANAVES